MLVTCPRRALHCPPLPLTPRHGYLLLILLAAGLPARTAAVRCPDVVTVALQIRPPFVLKASGGSFIGCVASPLSAMLEDCCEGRTRVEYVDVTEDTSKALLQHNVTFAMPVSWRPSQLTAHAPVISRKFIPTQLGGGSIYVGGPDTSGSTNILTSIFIDGWPFLIIMLLLAAYSALLIWICDCYWNHCHFPAFCPRGIWEGLWWAVVTMTTVGYGDRIPRSVVARLIGLLAILEGLVVCSLFTAAVTNAVSRPDFPTLDNTKVGVLRDTPEYTMALGFNGNPIEFTSMETLFASLHQGNVSGAYFDAYSWRYYITRTGRENSSISSDGLALYRSPLSDPHYYGVLAKDVSTELWQCMAANALDREGLVSRQLNIGWAILEQSDRSYSSQVLREVLPTNDSTLYGSMIAGIVWLVICFVITAVQCVYYHKKKVSLLSLIGDCNRSAQKTEENLSHHFLSKPLPEPEPPSLRDGLYNAIHRSTNGLKVPAVNTASSDNASVVIQRHTQDS